MPVEPCVKSPVWVLVIVRSGWAVTVMTVESVAVLLAALRSLCAVVTLIEFTFGDVASAATLTVTVMRISSAGHLGSENFECRALG